MGINLMEIYSATERAIKPRDTGTVSPAVVNLYSCRCRQMGTARYGILRLMAGLQPSALHLLLAFTIT